MTEPTTPPDEPQSALGEEPEEESGAGYGNHAPPAAEEPDQTDSAKG